MTATTTLVRPLILAEPDVPMPLRPIGVAGDLYVLRDLTGRDHYLSFPDICDADRLIILSGDGGAWLRRNFCRTRMIFGGYARGFGVNGLVAGHFLADLCIQSQVETIRTELRATPPHRWWIRLLDWLGGRRAFGGGTGR